MPQLATSKNLTILGILSIVGAVIDAAIALLSGKPLPSETIPLIIGGVTSILAKGQANTGGTVASTPEAKERIEK